MIYSMEMMVMTEDVMNENQNLTNELSKKKEVAEKQAVRSGRMQVSKLERVRNMFNRKSLRNYFDKWVGGALKIQGLDQAMEKLKKTERKHRLRNNFHKLRAQAKAEADSKRGPRSKERIRRSWALRTRKNWPNGRRRSLEGPRRRWSRN